MLNHILLGAICSVPTSSNHEEQMTAFLWVYCVAKGWKVEKDYLGSLKVTKGLSGVYPAVCAHIDSVQPVDRKFTVKSDGETIVATDAEGQQVGFGADDKTGVHVCLELLERADNLVAFFFVGEEIGMKGAREVPKSWFKNIGCVIEFDCPARYMVSYSCGGVRLFKNDSKFAKAIVPVLRNHKYTHWQDHPYTDVKTLRLRFPIACLNLASGYYNWHARNEYIRISEVEASVVVGHDLVRALGVERYRLAVGFDAQLDVEPAFPIEPLRVIDEHRERREAAVRTPHPSLAHSS